MNLKLYVWNCVLFDSPEWRLTLTALAENEDQAKTLVMQEVKTPEFREKIALFFADATNQPAIYDQPVAFIKSQGIPASI